MVRHVLLDESMLNTVKLTVRVRVCNVGCLEPVRFLELINKRNLSSESCLHDYIGRVIETLRAEI